MFGAAREAGLLASKFFARQYPSAGVGADLRVCPRNRDDTVTFTTSAFAGCAVLNNAQPVGHGKGGHAGYNTPQMLDKKQGMLRCKNAHLISHQ